MREQVKRELSWTEIQERTEQVMVILRLNDATEGEIASLKSAAKALQERINTRAAEARQLRHEIEQGYVWEDAPDPQQKLPIQDAPEAPWRDRYPFERFDTEYPIAVSEAELVATLKQVLTSEQFERLVSEDEELIHPWAPTSGVFNGVAEWARIELAHRDAAKAADGGKPFMAIPVRVDIPEKLAELVGDPPKQKRGRKTA